MAVLNVVYKATAHDPTSRHFDSIVINNQELRIARNAEFSVFSEEIIIDNSMKPMKL